MNALRIGSLCTGYGGLDVAVQAVIGGEHAWMAENDPHASKVLAHHWPAVPNLGDITVVGWASVEPVDILAAGVPCTDISNAGRREGIHGRQSGIWKNAAEAICILRPGLVVLENVSAIRTRGLDVITADLAAIGYDAIWLCLRASEVGAPHQRDRWFCLAFPAGVVLPAIDTGGAWRPQPAGVALLPTPAARDWKSAASNLLDVNSRPLNEFVVGRLPGESWVATDGTDYGRAVRHWEAVTGHPAPWPTEAGARGNRRLNPTFSEWMLGLPQGHVTAVPGVTRPHQIRIIGGGVVPLQGIAAIESMMAELERRAAA